MFDVFVINMNRYLQNIFLINIKVCCIKEKKFQIYSLKIKFSEEITKIFHYRALDHF